MADATKNLQVVITSDTAQAQAGIEGFGSSLSSFGSATTALGLGLIAKKIGDIGLSAVQSATDFQSNMALVQTQAGASAAEVQKMSQAILDMADSVGTTPEDLAQGLYHIESAGFRGAQALDMLRVAAEGAKVGQADLESVTNALVATVKSGIPGFNDMSGTMGVLNAIVGAGNMRMQDLTDSLSSSILPTAKVFGLTMA